MVPGRALTLLAAVALPITLHGLNNGLAATPGLGWNSDYCLNCAATAADAGDDASSGGTAPGASGHRNGTLGGYQNDAFVRHIADFLVSSGLAAMGYTNVNMDAGWDTFQRDASGDLVPDPSLWPGGINSTIAYVHSLGLRFGLYGDRGTLDCSKRPGQAGHEAQDAAFFAHLGIDWLKVDSCYAPGDQPSAVAEYGVIRDALNATGRPMWYALCGWESWYGPVGASLGNSWRIGEDTGSGWAAVMSNVQTMLADDGAQGRYAGPGGWADMSLLLLPGMGSGANLMTQERHRSQFTLHCIFAANMLLTGNLSSIDPYALETWGNAEAVAVNQDPHYKPYIVLQPDSDAVGASDSVTPQPEDSRAASAGYIAAYVAECGGEPAAQAWAFNQPASAFLFNNATNQCLNVEACGSSIIYDGCKTTGGTCAGPDKYSNEQWSLTAEGALVSALPGSLCATAGAGGILHLETCHVPLTSNQTWSFSAASGQLQTAGGLCLTAATPAPPAAATVLVGRQLSTGAWAVVALNNGATNASVVCGTACFGAMGLAPTQLLRVRDLWAHADLGTFPATTLPIPVGPNGSSTFWTLTPVACADDMDCNLNGVCNAAAGSCTCDAGWGGPTCASLQLLPSTRGDGTCDPSLNGTATGFTTTWGGNPVRDEETSTWHLFPAEMALHCGMTAWGSQSQVAHYTAPTLTGPYSRVGTAVGPFAHNPVVVPVPPGSAGPNISYLMMHIGLGCDSVGVHACNYSTMPSCEDGTTPSGTVPRGADIPVPSGLHRARTHVAAGLDSEWQAMPSDWTVPYCGNNPAPLFLANGSLMILCHEPMAAGLTCPNSAGLSMATSESSNWTHGAYTFQCLHVLNPTLAVGGQVYTAANEDPHLYADARGHLHILTHNQGPGYFNESWFGGDVRGDGGHFFSADGGATWRFTWHAAYSGAVEYNEGPSGTPPAAAMRYKRERPKLVQDDVSKALLGLSNGVSPALVDAFQPGQDPACTLVAAVAV